MSRNLNAIDPDVIDHFIRKAHVERSLAFSASVTRMGDSIKNIFSSPTVAGTARCG